MACSKTLVAGCFMLAAFFQLFLYQFINSDNEQLGKFQVWRPRQSKQGSTSLADAQSSDDTDDVILTTEAPLKQGEAPSGDRGTTAKADLKEDRAGIPEHETTQPVTFKSKTVLSEISHPEVTTKQKGIVTTQTPKFETVSKNNRVVQLEKIIKPPSIKKEPPKPVMPKIPTKVIVSWDTAGWFHSTNVANRDHCGNCPITFDRSRLNDSQTAAVIISHTNHVNDYPGVNSRRASQLYVWWSLESQSMTQLVDRRHNNNLSLVEDYFFNATLSLWRNSTFYTMSNNHNGFLNPAQIVQSGARHVTSNLTELLALKNKTAVWFVSNCIGGSGARRRLKLSDDLIASGLQVDRYGACFEKKSSHSERGKASFVRKIEKYRFYLSFENSFHCPGYITEKFFLNGLALGAVPITFGATREDYKLVAPPHSYIHVEDFNSTKELVDYLHYLEQNATAYAEYFAWRSLKPKEIYPYGRYMGFCAVCRSLFGIALNDTRSFTEIYGPNGVNYNSSVGFDETMRLKSVNDWWYGGASKECLESR